MTGQNYRVFWLTCFLLRIAKKLYGGLEIHSIYREGSSTHELTPILITIAFYSARSTLFLLPGITNWFFAFALSLRPFGIPLSLKNLLFM